MTELQWLDTYTGQTTAELVALEGQYRTDSIVCAFESAIQVKADSEGLASLSDEERVVLAVEAIEREVNNGGYSQFFFNSSNQHALTAVAALIRVGCDEAAQLTQRAIDVLGIDGLLTAEAIEAALDEDDENQEDALGACDDVYYKFENDLAGPLLTFIKAHQDQIRLGAKPAERLVMPYIPTDTDPTDWQKFFAMEANNRAWELAGQTRTGAEDQEMLHAAHGSAMHWAAVGTRENVMRATMLLALVHALIDDGGRALTYADEMKSFFLQRGEPDWEIAFTHTVYALAAKAAGDFVAYMASYREAGAALEQIEDDEDRAIVQRTFDLVPVP